MAACSMCKGSKRCYACDGTGKRLTGDEPCSVCSGTKSCNWCHGSGIEPK